MDYTYSFHNLAIATAHSTAAEANEPDCWVCTKSPSSTRNQLSWVSVPLNSQWYEDRHLRYEFSPKKVSIRPFRQEGFVASLKGGPWVCLESKPIDKLTDSAAAGNWKCQQSLEMDTMDGDGQFTSSDHTDEKGSLMPATFHRSVSGSKGNWSSSTDSSKTLLYTTSTEHGREFLQKPVHQTYSNKPPHCRVFSWMEFLRPCRLLRQCGYLQID